MKNVLPGEKREKYKRPNRLLKIIAPNITHNMLYYTSGNAAVPLIQLSFRPEAAEWAHLQAAAAGLPDGVLERQKTRIWRFQKSFGIEKNGLAFCTGFGINLAFSKAFGIENLEFGVLAKFYAILMKFGINLAFCRLFTCNFLTF